MPTQFTSVTMPRLGESVSEGTVTRWLKKIGDTVVAGEPLLEVSTDKVDSEVASPATGIVLAIVVEADATVDIGVELARIGESVSPSAALPTNSSIGAGSAPANEGRGARAVTGPAAARHAGPRQTLLVRRLLREHGLDADSLVGTGINGRIRKGDVLSAIADGTRVLPEADKFVEVETAAHGAVRHGDSTAVAITTVDLTELMSLSPAPGTAGYDQDTVSRVVRAVVECLRSVPALCRVPGEHNQISIRVRRQSEPHEASVVITNAQDLNHVGILRQLARAEPGEPTAYAAATFDLHIGSATSDGLVLPLSGRHPHPALILGSPSRRPTAVTLESGAEAISIRTLADTALIFDQSRTPEAAAFVSMLKTELLQAHRAQ